MSEPKHDFRGGRRHRIALGEGGFQNRDDLHSIYFSVASRRSVPKSGFLPLSLEGPAMVILILGLILLGSFSTAAFLMIQGASWGMITLGYMGGGWAGLILGLSVLYLSSVLSRLRDRDMVFALRKGQSQP